MILKNLFSIPKFKESLGTKIFPEQMTFSHCMMGKSLQSSVSCRSNTANWDVFGWLGAQRRRAPQWRQSWPLIGCVERAWVIVDPHL